MEKKGAYTYITKADLAKYIMEDGRIMTRNGAYMPKWTVSGYLDKTILCFDDQIEFIGWAKLGDITVEIVFDNYEDKYYIMDGSDEDPLEPTAEDLHEYQYGWLEGALL